MNIDYEFLETFAGQVLPVSDVIFAWKRHHAATSTRRERMRHNWVMELSNALDLGFVDTFNKDFVFFN